MKSKFISIKQSFLSRELLFYKVIFGLVIISIIFHLFDYSQASMHREAVHFNSRRGPDSGFIHNSLKNGTKLVPGDFLRCFDVLSFECWAPRVRFFSNLVMLLNFKLRVWLWNYIPPHPSFSLSWIFSFFSLVLLYKLIYNLTLDRAAAWMGLSLYAISPGYLSGILLLFHPAKPLSNFFTILCFYLASRIIIYVENKQYFSKKGFIWLLVFMLLGFFTDETAWFIFIFIPILFPGIFKIKGKSTFIILSYCFVGIAFSIFILFLAPSFLKQFGFKDFNFISYLKYPGDPGGPFKFFNVFLQGYYFISEYISPFKTSSSYNYYVYILFFIYSIFAFTGLSLERKKLFLRILISFFIFLLLQITMLTKHLVVVRTSWYYGSLFPIFFSLLAAFLLSVKSKGLNILNKCVFLLLLLISSSHCSYSWSYTPGLTFHKVLNAWNKRGDIKALSSLGTHYPPGTAWLFTELKYARRPDQNQSSSLIERLAFFLGDIYKTKNLLARDSTILTADSYNKPQESVYSLIDNNFHTYWHVSLKKLGQPHWVIADFGEKNGKIVRSLAARPRSDIPSQFFRKAKLFGSNDDKSWEAIADIIQKKMPRNNKWRKWQFDNDRAFRHYKFMIYSGYTGRRHNFFSMAELALFE